MMKVSKLNKYFLLFFVLISIVTQVEASANKTNHTQSIVLGSGCFWGAEKGYEQIRGVEDAVSGYADGRGVSPNYRSITQFKNKYNNNNFAEVVEVTFNSNEISLRSIIKHFFESHDPTQSNRQGNDIGTQYRSTILYKNNEE